MLLSSVTSGYVQPAISTKSAKPVRRIGFSGAGDVFVRNAEHFTMNIRDFIGLYRTIAEFSIKITKTAKAQYKALERGERRWEHINGGLLTTGYTRDPIVLRMRKLLNSRRLKDKVEAKIKDKGRRKEAAESDIRLSVHQGIKTRQVRAMRAVQSLYSRVDFKDFTRQMFPGMDIKKGERPTLLAVTTALDLAAKQVGIHKIKPPERRNPLSNALRSFLTGRLQKDQYNRDIYRALLEKEFAGKADLKAGTINLSPVTSEKDLNEIFAKQLYTRFLGINLWRKTSLRNIMVENSRKADQRMIDRKIEDLRDLEDYQARIEEELSGDPELRLPTGLGMMLSLHGFI